MIKPPTFGADRNVRFAAKYAAMLAPFISTEESRYYLRGLYVTPHPDGGVILVATDGVIMGIVHDCGGVTNGNWTCPLPMKIVRAAAKATAEYAHFIGHAACVTAEFKDGRNPDWWDAHSAAEISETHLAYWFAPAIDCTYPDFTRPIPRPDKVKPCHFAVDPNLIATFRSAAKVIGREYLMLRTTDPGQNPIIVEIEETPEFIGLLAPTRRDIFTDEYREPDWLTPILPKREVAA